MTDADGGGRQRPLRALGLLDESVDFLRAHAGAVLPPYLCLAFPFAFVSLLFIEAASIRSLSSLLWLAAALVVTGYLRWLGGAAVQRRVYALRTGRELPAWREMLPPYLWLRLLLRPLFAGPVALDPLNRNQPLAVCTKLWRGHVRFFLRFAALSTLFFLIAVAQVLAAQYFLSELVLPFVLGIDSQALRSVLGGAFWFVSVIVLCLLAAECFLMVAGVLLYETLMSRWSGSDLLTRVERFVAAGEADGKP